MTRGERRIRRNKHHKLDPNQGCYILRISSTKKENSVIVSQPRADWEVCFKAEQHRSILINSRSGWETK